jgi:hypothetical protein
MEANLKPFARRCWFCFMLKAAGECLRNLILFIQIIEQSAFILFAPCADAFIKQGEGDRQTADEKPSIWRGTMDELWFLRKVPELHLLEVGTQQTVVHSSSLNQEKSLKKESSTGKYF